jgi:hypothetical protein
VKATLLNEKSALDAALVLASDFYLCLPIPDCLRIARELVKTQITTLDACARNHCLGCQANKVTLDLNDGTGYHVDGYGPCTSQFEQSEIQRLAWVLEKLDVHQLCR